MIKSSAQQKYRVLIYTTDRLSQMSLYELLSGSGYQVDIADSTSNSLKYLNDNIYNVVLTDIDAQAGIDMLRALESREHDAEVVILSSYGNKGGVPDAIKRRAYNHLTKPAEDRKILSAIEKALAKRCAGGASMASVMRRVEKDENNFYGLIGTMSEIYSLIERVANSKATILVRGESGTGKRMIARAIHQADKKRRDKPFIEMSCGALPREIIESELFGHTKGSFTGAISDRKGRFELANGGTILLDDIDSFSLDLQVKLLRVLQQKEFERVGDHKTMKVDVRIVASTNQDLEKLVAEKKFREDLYYRLNVIAISIPPLRKRKQDLPDLVNHFINLYSKENNKKILSISCETLSTLTGYNWPGNIRELENVIERAVILDTDNIIGTDDLPEMIVSAQNMAVEATTAAAVGAEDASSLKNALKDPEKLFILKVLEEAGWNKKKAAQKLGVNRTTLYNKMRKHNLGAEAHPDKT